MENLSSAILVSVVVKSILDRIAEPLRTKYPQLDLWWFDWLALLLGGVVAWFAGLNLFQPYFDNVLLGRIVTAFAVGGGANLLNTIFSNAGALPPAIHGREIFSAPENVTLTRPRGW